MRTNSQIMRANSQIMRINSWIARINSQIERQNMKDSCYSEESTVPLEKVEESSPKKTSDVEIFIAGVLGGVVLTVVFFAIAHISSDKQVFKDEFFEFSISSNESSPKKESTKEEPKPELAGFIKVKPKSVRIKHIKSMANEGGWINPSKILKCSNGTYQILSFQSIFGERKDDDVWIWFNYFEKPQFEVICREDQVFSFSEASDYREIDDWRFPVKVTIVDEIKEDENSVFWIERINETKKVRAFNRIGTN